MNSDIDILNIHLQVCNYFEDRIKKNTEMKSRLSELEKTLLSTSDNSKYRNDIERNIDILKKHILNIENKQLQSYKGNYYKFKSAFAKKLQEENKKYENYSKKLKESMSFSGIEIGALLRKEIIKKSDLAADISQAFFENRYGNYNFFN